MESFATRDGKYEFAVSFMCVRLHVSRSGFYEWRDRQISATAQRREDIARSVVWAFAESDETYGYRRVHAELARWQVVCSPELVRSIMRELGLVPCQPRPWRHSLTVAGDRPHHRRRRRGPDPRSRGPGLHRRRAGREDGR
jgi:putative transposase